ncbi:MAG: carbohydrate-binding protein [Clostridia bacterium]|nr:carbohydrate-binding protein [Clostridia bacterium]
MKKKFVSILIVLTMLLSMQNTFAYLAYNVGPITYELENENIVDVEKASVEQEGINVNADGAVTYDFYLPFNAVSFDVTYTSAQDFSLSFVTEERTVTASLVAGENITENVSLAITERKGERIVSFSVTGACSIKKIIFNKEKVETANVELFLCDLTEKETAIQSAVLLDTKASMLMVNGGRRYIDNNDPREIPYTFEGRVYLPAHTLARAFGMYIEDMPHRDYLLIRNDKTEFVFYKQIAYKEIFGSSKAEINNVVIYKDGEAYLPLRYFAESIGKTVGYKDGIIAIDDKFSVADILNNEDVFEYVRGEFEAFYPDNSMGRTYYVSQTSETKDTPDGSAERPFKTLEEAAQVAVAGDTVIVHEGVYRETLIPKNSGTPTAPIVFKAADGEDVVISAADTVSGFKLDSKGYYKAPISWNLGDGRNQVFYNGKSMVEARYPNGPAIEMGENNEPLSSLWPVLGDIVSSDEDKYLLTSDTLLSQEENYWKGATLVAMRGQGWCLSTAKVQESGNGYLKVEDTSNYYWYDQQVRHWKYAYLSGHINALDTYEEWIIDGGYLYFIPPKNANTSGLEVEVKRRQLVADLSQNSFVKLDGFKTIGGSIKMNDSEMCTLSNMEMKYLNHFVKSKDQHSGFIDDANVSDPKGAPSRGEVGIYIGGRDNIVINNTMDSAAGAAIYGVGCYTYIENNLIKDCGYAGSYVAGLYFSGEAWKPATSKRGGHFIYHNTVYNAGRSVLQHTRPAGQGLWPYLPEEIAYNDFHDGMLASLDTGVTYEYYVLMGHEKLFTKMHHNLVYVTSEQWNPYSMGIYHDGGSENIDTYCNVVFSEKPNIGFSDAYIHTSKADESESYCPCWNNIQIMGGVEGGKDGLVATDFPNQKPFYAGAFGDEEYLVNFNAISKAEVNTDIYYAKDAVLSSGTALNGYAAVLDEVGEYVKFEDVNFHDGKNEISIEFYGDKYNTGDKIEIIIGNDTATQKVYSGTLIATSPMKDDVNIFRIQIGVISGEKDVLIKTTSPKSAQILSMKPGRSYFDYVDLDSQKLYGGWYTYYVGENLASPPERRYLVPDDAANPTVFNTYNGTTIVYEDVLFAVSPTTFEASVSAASGYHGQTIEIRIDDLQSEPVVELTTVNTGNWYNFGILNAEVQKQISTGKHTVYLSFKGSGLTSVYWFKFGN